MQATTPLDPTLKCSCGYTPEKHGRSLIVYKTHNVCTACIAETGGWIRGVPYSVVHRVGERLHWSHSGEERGQR